MTINYARLADEARLRLAATAAGWSWCSSCNKLMDAIYQAAGKRWFVCRTCRTATLIVRPKEA